MLRAAPPTPPPARPAAAAARTCRCGGCSSRCTAGRRSRCSPACARARSVGRGGAARGGAQPPGGARARRRMFSMSVREAYLYLYI